LIWAAEGKQNHDWELQSWLAAWLTNLKLAKGKKPVQPRDINPLLQGQKKKKKRIDAGGVISHLMPPEVAKQWEELATIKKLAIESGDWSKFNAMKATLNAHG